MLVHRLLRSLPARSFLVVACAVWLISSRPGLEAGELPRLVVVISVDQLAADYLTRFRHQFHPSGFFAKAMQEGAVFENCHHQHAFTVTGPGHAALLTGTHPNRHGIVGNAWFDREKGESVNCVADSNSAVVGAPSGEGASPVHLLVPTLADELKLATRDAAKVYGIAIKDRSAILMSGHAADGAFWLDGKGQWVSSTHYLQLLPGFLRGLNDSRLVDSFAGRPWTLVDDPAVYTHHAPDDNPWEKPGAGLSSSFPHVLPDHQHEHYYEQLKTSPFGDEWTLSAASQVMEFERLGKDDVPDLLAIGLSSYDYVGHNFGPHSLEIEDMFRRLDQRLGELLAQLDDRVGAGRWTLVLTADHGVAPNPEFAKHQGLSAKRDPLGSASDVQNRLEHLLRRSFPVEPGQPALIQRFESNQIYLRRDHPALAGDELARAQRGLQEWLVAQPSIAAAITRQSLLEGRDQANPLARQLARSFHPARSGDVLFVFVPYQGYIGSTTATHGSPWAYDTHVPLIFLGAGVRAGHFLEPTSPGALAPTLARLLRITPPAACEERALVEALQ